MIYVDTSVLVAFFTNEATAQSIAGWYEEEMRPLVSGDWCITEFASALAIKERTAQLTHEQCNAVWEMFSEFCGTGLTPLALERETFHLAAQLVRESNNGLRAGDALHLALALRIKASAFATLDVKLRESVRQNNIQLVELP